MLHHIHTPETFVPIEVVKVASKRNFGYSLDREREGAESPHKGELRRGDRSGSPRATGEDAIYWSIDRDRESLLCESRPRPHG